MRKAGIYDGDRYLGQPLPVPEPQEGQTRVGAFVSPEGKRWMSEEEMRHYAFYTERRIRIPQWLILVIAVVSALVSAFNLGRLSAYRDCHRWYSEVTAKPDAQPYSGVSS